MKLVFYVKEYLKEQREVKHFQKFIYKKKSKNNASVCKVPKTSLTTGPIWFLSLGKIGTPFKKKFLQDVAIYLLSLRKVYLILMQSKN